MSGSPKVFDRKPADRTGTLRLPDLGVVRILLVDDDPQALALIDMALADAPFTRTIEIATTAAAGIRRIKDDEHDIYLIDQQLPDGTGVEVIHQAKAVGNGKPFILLTGYGTTALDEAASREGAADYVEKHMVGAHLERSIRYALRTWQSGRMLHDREEQLRQAQKMEAIGRLAGGVAHDFNNILTIISGYGALLLRKLGDSNPMRREVEEIQKSAERAAALTRQLLAFSRRQLLNPKLLDLNSVVAGTEKMLRRLIGEDIELQTVFDRAAGRIKADPTQIEQVILNLVVNARDAMPLGGKLTIQVAAVRFDCARELPDGELAPGPYAMLAVTDTGLGMSEEVKAHLFEPFFTTKEKGKGTGLGLATCYGIIKQSAGSIRVYSEPDHGSIFRVYLPCAEDAAEYAPPVPESDVVLQGKETIMVVEDEEGIRDLAAWVLRDAGYTVLEACNGLEGLRLAQEQPTRKIDLVVTDVIMPHMGGKDMADRLRTMLPDTRILFTSGYTDDALAHHGVLNPGVAFLEKPFSPARLACRVRETLDQSQAATHDETDSI